MRKKVINAGHMLYPSYYMLQKAKILCCPSEEYITITDTRADISLQSLLDLTAHKLCDVQNTVLKQIFKKDSSSQFTLLSKWGCDGAQAIVHANKIFQMN